jgi:hypothetical protein
MDKIAECIKELGKALGEIFVKFKDSLFATIKIFFDTLYSWLSNLLGKVVDWIDFGIEAMGVIAKSIWDNVSPFFKGVFHFFSEIWDWFKRVIESCYEWIIVVLDGYGLYFDRLYEYFCNWVLELIWWWIEYSIEEGLQYADWTVGTGKRIFELIISYLPEIALPQGFDAGLQYFVAYGILLNELLPFEEMLWMIQLYFSVYLAIIVHSHVKGWWRWIAWFK